MSTFLSRHLLVLSIALTFVIGSFASCDTKKSCDTDAVCAKGEICLLDLCQVGCRTEAQCESGKFCVDFRCVADECLAGAARVCYDGAKGTLGIGLCRGGTQLCKASGRWGDCSGQLLVQRESCDRLDNDCNGKIDDVSDPKGCTCPKPGNKRSCFPGAVTLAGTGLCKAGIQYCEADNQWGHCLDYVLPSQEICDGKDNDCDGKVDEDAGCGCKEGEARSCYSGPIGTLHLPCARGTQTCSKDGWSVCKDEVVPTKELCGDGIDNDCNGLIDDGDACPKDETTIDEPVGDAGNEVTPDVIPEVQPEPSCQNGVKRPCERLTPLLTNTGGLQCSGDVQECTNGVWSGCQFERISPLGEKCNQRDDDCNGIPDDQKDCKPRDASLCGSGPCAQTYAGPHGYIRSYTKNSTPTNSMAYPYFKAPSGLAVGNGFVFMADRRQHRIWKFVIDPIDNAKSKMILFAGAGLLGANDGPGLQAKFNQPHGLAYNSDTSGKSQGLLVADTENNCIRLVTALGLVSTLAGKCGDPPDANDGKGTAARFNKPMGLALYTKKGTPGNPKIVLYVADSGNHTIRKIDLDGTANVTTVYGSLGATGVQDGDADKALFNNPTDVAVDPTNGDLYVADLGNRRVRHIQVTLPIPQVRTMVGDCSGGALCPEDYTLVGNRGSKLRAPRALAFQPRDGLYIVDARNHAIIKIAVDPALTATTVLGPASPNAQGPHAPGKAGFVDGAGNVARFDTPFAIAFAPPVNGNAPLYFVADTQNQRLRMIKPGPPDVAVTVAGAFDNSIGVPVQKSTVSLENALFALPLGIVFDSAGNKIYIAETGSIPGTVRVIDVASGTVSRLGIPTLSKPAFLVLDNGLLYISDVGNHNILVYNLSQQKVVTTIGPEMMEGAGAAAAAGSSVKASVARFNQPQGMAVDSKKGLLFIVDASNKAIRRYDLKNRDVHTLKVTGSCIAGKLPHQIALDRDTLLVTYFDVGSSPGHICKLTSQPNSTYDATKLVLQYTSGVPLVRPGGLVVGKDNALYVLDVLNNNAYKFDKDGKEVWSFHRSGGGFLDGGSTQALFFSPAGITFFGQDKLLVTDYQNNRIRTIYEK